jgi:DNA-binding NarL/FixJ family response regulator
MMEEKKIKVFILGDNALVANGLRHFLRNRFGSTVQAVCFYDMKSCVRRIDEETSAVVLDYFVEGKGSAGIVRSIKTLNPRTSIIMHSSNEDVADSIEALLQGETTLFITAKKFRYKLEQQYN